MVPATEMLASRIQMSSQGFVTFYDTEYQRAWLVDGTSALLHLLRFSLQRISRRRSSAILWYDNGTEKVDFPFVSEKPTDTTARRGALRKCLTLTGRYGHRKVRCADLLESTLVRMDLAGERLLHARSDMNFIHASAREYLLGIDLSSLTALSNTMMVKSQQIREGSAWPELVNGVNAITVFGKGFGDMVEPDWKDLLCKPFLSCPPGQDYLATTVNTISCIGKRTDAIRRLTDRLNWVVQDAWECQNSQCAHVQKISAIRTPIQGPNLVPEQSDQRRIYAMLQSNPEGALIFGSTEKGSSDKAAPNLAQLQDRQQVKHEDSEATEGANEPTNAPDTQPSTPGLSECSCPTPSEILTYSLDAARGWDLPLLDACSKDSEADMIWDFEALGPMVD